LHAKALAGGIVQSIAFYDRSIRSEKTISVNV
jgi:hypothetical protein